MRKLLLSAIGMAALGVLAPPAGAQPAPSPYPGGQYPPGQYTQGQYPGGQTQGAASGTSSASSAQAAASRLHDALHLNDDQDSAWRAYQSAIAPDPQQAARSRQAQQLLPTIPTPRRLALLRAEMQSNLATFDHNAQAVTAFYNTLSPEQQRTFDQETARGAQQR